MMLKGMQILSHLKINTFKSKQDSKCHTKIYRIGCVSGWCIYVGRWLAGLKPLQVVHLFVAWIMSLFQRQIPNARCSGFAVGWIRQQWMATKWPSATNRGSKSATSELPYFYSIFAHVCRACKSVEIFMFLWELATTTTTATTSCRCRALNIAQKGVAGRGAMCFIEWNGEPGVDS